MRAVSDQFLQALRGSHRVVSRATLLTSYQEGTAPTGTEIDILGGDVKLSSTADVRGTLELLTDGTNWNTLTSNLRPYGNEIFVERGIELGNGQVEYVSLGYYRIYSVEQDDPPHGPLQISGRDRMSGVIDAKLEAPYTASGATHSAEFAYHLFTATDSPYHTASAPTVTAFDDTLGATNVKTGIVVDQDRYTYLRDLVKANGKIFYFGYDGKSYVEAPPDATTPLWEVNAGAYGVLLDDGLSRGLTREGRPNAVVATGEAADDTPPVRAVIRDINPDSPTFYYGSYGPVPEFYSSANIDTHDKAVSSATALLRQYLGTPTRIDFSSIVNPALEPFDPIRVNWVNSSAVVVLDEITIPLMASEAMTATTRQSLDEIFEEA